MGHDICNDAALADIHMDNFGVTPTTGGPVGTVPELVVLGLIGMGATRRICAPDRKC